MSYQQQEDLHASDPMTDVILKIAFAIVVMLVAWPALLLAFLLHRAIRQFVPSLMLTLVTGIVGIGALYLLFQWLDPLPLFQVELADAGGLLSHHSIADVSHFFSVAFPVWLRGLLVSPLIVAGMEVLQPTNLERELLLKEKQRHTRLARRARKAIGKARNAPDEIDGQAILGILIDNPMQ